MKQSPAFRENRDKYKHRHWTGKRAAEAKRAMDAADKPYSDAELIERAIADGKLKRLPPVSAVGGSMAEHRKDWK